MKKKNLTPAEIDALNEKGAKALAAKRADRDRARLAAKRAKGTTKAEDAAYMLGRLADARRAWKPGDACRSFHRGVLPTTTVLRVEGSIVYLADGSDGHVSNMLGVR